jgi:hypothetical protein
MFWVPLTTDCPIREENANIDLIVVDCGVALVGRYEYLKKENESKNEP